MNIASSRVSIDGRWNGASSALNVIVALLIFCSRLAFSPKITPRCITSLLLKIIFPKSSGCLSKVLFLHLVKSMRLDLEGLSVAYKSKNIVIDILYWNSLFFIFMRRSYQIQKQVKQTRKVKAKLFLAMVISSTVSMQHITPTATGRMRLKHNHSQISVNNR